MPWGPWWEAATTGDLWPLAVAFTVRFLYYLVGVWRMTLGYGPWGCGVPEVDVPSPVSDG